MSKIRNLLWISLIFVSCSFADSKDKKKEGYRYTVRNYFSGGESTPRRDMVLYLGSAVYSGAKTFKRKPFSSFIAGFRQQIWKISNIGDISLKTEIQSFLLKTGRATQINVNPVFSLPDTENGFPIYVGLGAGIGFYPYYILMGEPSLSLNGQFFTGLRLVNLYENLGLSAELVLNMHVPFKESQLYMETIASLGLLFSF